MKQVVSEQPIVSIGVDGNNPFVIGCEFFSSEARVILGEIGNGLRERLFDKKEQAAPRSVLRVQRFEAGKVSFSEIYGKLHEVMFGHFWKLLCLQGQGGEGALFAEPYMQNIARVRTDRASHVLVAHWNNLMSTDDRGGWNKGWCLTVLSAQEAEKGITRKFATVSY